MTTLIIHPELDIQKTYAFNLAGEYLDVAPEKLQRSVPPDLHLLDGTLTNSLGINDVRQLLRTLQYQPYQASSQVGLILLANTLTEEAQNALLKSLEEPGPSTRFILTTPHEKFLLPTIISRCQTLFIRERIHLVAPTTDTTTSNVSFATDFMQLELVDKFMAIEPLFESDKTAPGTILTFLTNLLQIYRQKLLRATATHDNQTATSISADIRKIQRAVHYLKYNANKRLTLENLILQLEKSIMTVRQ